MQPPQTPKGAKLAKPRPVMESGLGEEEFMMSHLHDGNIQKTTRIEVSRERGDDGNGSLGDVETGVRGVEIL